MEKFNFKKKFGQNFIKDKNIVKKIVDLSLIPEDTLVIEVGTGRGILTRELVGSAKNVISYEIDTTLAEYLNKEFSNFDNLEIIFDDFMKRDIVNDIKKYDYKNIYFIANVPYYVTTPILMKLINLELKVNKIVMMIQKEVGERFSAIPGSRDYSSISVYLNYFYDVKKLFKVGKENFMPVPKVDSVVIELTLKEELLKVNNLDLFFKLVRDSFKFKRKTLKNNLKDYNLNAIFDVLRKYNYDLSIRAEQLPVEIFVEISNNL